MVYEMLNLAAGHVASYKDFESLHLHCIPYAIIFHVKFSVPQINKQIK